MTRSSSIGRVGRTSHDMATLRTYSQAFLFLPSMIFTQETAVVACPVNEPSKPRRTTSDPSHIFPTPPLSVLFSPIIQDNGAESYSGTFEGDTEFGECQNEQYRHISRHRTDETIDDHIEPDAPHFTMLSTYLSYIILICLGHMRDFFGKRFRPQAYSHLMPHNVSLPTFTSFRC